MMPENSSKLSSTKVAPLPEIASEPTEAELEDAWGWIRCAVEPERPDYPSRKYEVVRMIAKAFKAERQPVAAPVPLGEPAMPMTIGNWTMDEWKAAEARVFAMRVLYNPDALSAIYKDIAINLQAELDRMNAALTSRAVPLGEGEKWETFCDAAYFDMWAVRPVGENQWGHCFHVPSKDEAAALLEILQRGGILEGAYKRAYDRANKHLTARTKLQAELSRLRSQEGPEDAWKRGFWAALVAASLDIEDEDEDHLQEQVLAIRGNILSLQIRPYTPPNEGYTIGNGSHEASRPTIDRRTPTLCLRVCAPDSPRKVSEAQGAQAMPKVWRPLRSSRFEEAQTKLHRPQAIRKAPRRSGAFCCPSIVP